MTAPVSAWRAFYIGGREFDSTSDAWRDLPATGVLAVRLFLDEWATDTVQYKRTLYGRDWYWFVPVTDTYHSGMTRPGDVPDTLVKRGDWADDDEWERVRQHVHTTTTPTIS